jgi:uncharacterized protein YegP (UPF0339 family)
MRHYRLNRYRSRGEWRWRLFAPNGKKIANGGESYKRLAGLNKGLASVLRGLRACMEK